MSALCCCNVKILILYRIWRIRYVCRQSKNLYQKSGKGGDGHVSFRREKYVPDGGPDGGDGGRWRQMFIFEVDEGLNTLTDFRHITTNICAQNGEEGGKKNCRGKDGADIVLKVPEGTVIKEVSTPEKSSPICPVITARVCDP